jgi:NAD(P)-dependent dehydrogenase (short-subunit alcohol dehydrogenase family)
MDYIKEMFSLEGKTAVITGGGGVLAGAIAEALLKAGAAVSLWGHRTNSLDIAVKKLTKASGAPEKINSIVVDAGDEDAVKNAFSELEKSVGTPEILINGVGGNIGKSPFVEIDTAQFETILHLNLVAGLVVPTKIFADRWITKKIKGSVVNIASMSSYIPLSGVWAYDAAKAGVLNLTMGCAKEFAPYGIRVNAISPGFFLGKQNRHLLIDEETGELTDRGRAVTERTPFGRFGRAEELAGVVIFLACTRASAFITGVTIPVDGGFLVDNI